jgi:hypothetical protein
VVMTLPLSFSLLSCHVQLSVIFLPSVRGEFPCLKGGISPCPLGQGISARFLWPGFLSRPGSSGPGTTPLRRGLRRERDQHPRPPARRRPARGSRRRASPGAPIRLGDGDVAGGVDDTAPGSMAAGSAGAGQVVPIPRHRRRGRFGDRRGDHAGVDQHLRDAGGPPRRRTRRYPGAVRRWRRRHQARARWHRCHAQHKAAGAT